MSYHVVTVYYKYGHSDISSFETSDDLREFLLREYSAINSEDLDTTALIEAVVRKDAESDSEWRIIAVFQGALLCSWTNRGFA